jgi:RecG-like helicase
MIAISATLPSSYRESLHTYAGLKQDYILINLRNYRPELSTVIIPMQNDTSSFRDIAFLLPFGIRMSELEPTIIYSDDLDVLTAMFWWAQSRLAAIELPVHLVDILHAGLTSDHQKKCLSDFRTGVVMLLLASEKIGVGMNFANVRRVVQYLCKGLTLVRWEQRRGRCARTRGMTGTGYIIAESRMISGTDVTVNYRYSAAHDLVVIRP